MRGLDSIVYFCSTCKCGCWGYTSIHQYLPSYSTSRYEMPWILDSTLRHSWSPNSTDLHLNLYLSTYKYKRHSWGVVHQYQHIWETLESDEEGNLKLKKNKNFENWFLFCGRPDTRSDKGGSRSIAVGQCLGRGRRCSFTGNSETYLFKYQNVFVQITNFICPVPRSLLHWKFWNLFV